MSDEGRIRLQKFLAQSGVASRRRCEDFMTAGRVEVNGEVITQMGARVNPLTDVVRVDGKRLPPPSEHAYLVLNKPRGVVSSMSDEQGRPDLSGIVANREERLFHVGRLDTDTSGLLVLTNDGDFAQRLAHPSFEITKTYVALVDGIVKDNIGPLLKTGVMLDDGEAKVDRFIVKDTSRGSSLVELDIHMGRNRIVRRMLAEVGHPVRELTRTGFGPIHLGGLRSGVMRELSRDELGELFDSVDS
ncbi:MAG: rRNA pseudouridine synthase [Actinomycetota bacterium]|nr:rRNA pseudouridine synthase [Actinomycetota bacterium]